MSIQRIYPRELLLASIALVRPKLRMQQLVAITVKLPRKALVAPRPGAVERLLLIMRSYMTCCAKQTNQDLHQSHSERTYP